MQDFRRARTAYDLYGMKPDFTSVDPLPDIPSAMKPADMPTDDYFERMGTIHPLAGSQTARAPGGHMSRPRTRAACTPRASSFDVGIQADVATMSQQMYNNPFTGCMDPVNQQYYYREWARKPPSPRQPIYRSGRLGSPWRHVKSCINNGGSHLVFIDDAPRPRNPKQQSTVKTEENFFYPPEETLQPPDLSMYISPRLARRTLTKRPDLSSTYNERAKQGFKYWYNEPQPINLSSKYDFGGRSRWLGVSGESLAGRNPRFAVRY